MKPIIVEHKCPSGNVSEFIGGHSHCHNPEDYTVYRCKKCDMEYGDKKVIPIEHRACIELGCEGEVEVTRLPYKKEKKQYQAGTMSTFKPNYNKGPTSWN